MRVSHWTFQRKTQTTAMQIQKQQELCGDWMDFSEWREVVVYLLSARFASCSKNEPAWGSGPNARLQNPSRPPLAGRAQPGWKGGPSQVLRGSISTSLLEQGSYGEQRCSLIIPCWSVLCFHVSLPFPIAETRCICNIWKREISSKGKVLTCQVFCSSQCCSSSVYILACLSGSEQTPSVGGAWSHTGCAVC